MRGAPCKAYADRTNKSIYLEMHGIDGKKLFERKYTVEAGSLECFWQWEKENDLTVVFYEYGEKYVASKSGQPIPDLRQIFSVSISGSETKENYVHSSVPEWLTNITLYYENRDIKQQNINIYFPLDEDTLKSTINSIRTIAKESGLEEKNVTPNNLSGFLASYSAQNFNLWVRRIDSSKEIEVSITDNGNRKLSQKVAEQVNKLGSIRAQRYFSLQIPIFNISKIEILNIVSAIAKDYGLTESSSCPPADLICYGNKDSIKIEVGHFERPEKIWVSIYETNSRDLGLKIEKALREKLPYIGKEDKL